MRVNERVRAKYLNPEAIQLVTAGDDDASHSPLCLCAQIPVYP